MATQFQKNFSNEVNVMTETEKKDLRDFEKDIIEFCSDNWNDLQTNQKLLDEFNKKREKMINTLFLLLEWVRLKQHNFLEINIIKKLSTNIASKKSIRR